MVDFRRPHHRVIARILGALNGGLLSQAACYFGGGTHLAMSFGEYRESRDIDFLCSSRAGFRLVREEVTDRSLGRVLGRPFRLAREVRGDRDGIRTFLAVDDLKIKFEILLEARIDLAGAIDPNLAVPVLSTEHAIAEKLLANTDRGLDDSALSRDLVDLAFVAAQVDKHKLQSGLVIAEQAYGAGVRRMLKLSLHSFQNRARAKNCIEALAIGDTATLRKGIRLLQRLSG